MRASRRGRRLSDGRSWVAPLAGLPLTALLLAGCTPDGGISDEKADAPSSDLERVEVLAPIEDAELEVGESAPPQHAVRVVSGLPSGCAELERIDVERDGADIEVTVWNTVPADEEEVACTAIYRSTDNTVALGGDFEAGTRYSVTVNRDVTLSFTAR